MSSGSQMRHLCVWMKEITPADVTDGVKGIDQQTTFLPDIVELPADFRRVTVDELQF